MCLNKHGHPLDTPTITPTKEREVDWPRYRKCVGLCLLKDLGPALRNALIYVCMRTLANQYLKNFIIDVLQKYK